MGHAGYVPVQWAPFLGMTCFAVPFHVAGLVVWSWLPVCISVPPKGSSFLGVQTRLVPHSEEVNALSRHRRE